MTSKEINRSVAAAVANANAPAPLRKRFYKEALSEQRDGHAVVLLDGRVLRTPGKCELCLPGNALAEAIAAEWQAQDKHIDPISMPLTRIANSAIDGVSGREDETRADIVKYAGSDLLCYRAERPGELVARQAEAWDPVLQWARDELGVSFTIVQGIMPVDQSTEALAAIAKAVATTDALALAASHMMTTLTGSALLALAHVNGHITAADAWQRAHIDEDFQIEKWGDDAEATARRAARRADMLAASRFLALLG